MIQAKSAPVRRLRIPESLWRKAKAQAALEGKALSQWWADAAEEKLMRTKGKKEG